jgi:hypothetical protein
MTLTDTELDEVLTSAAVRIRGVATSRSVQVHRATAPPLRLSGRLAFAMVGTAAAVAAAVFVRSSDRSRTEQVGKPPSFVVDGSSGEEVTLVMRPGDGDPEVVELVSPIGNRVVRVLTGSKAKQSSSLAASAASEPGRVSIPWVCVVVEEFSTCAESSPSMSPQMQSGYRAANGGVLVSWIPPDVAFATMAAGGERWWARPVDGIALFPFTESAGPDVTIRLFDASGAPIQTLEGSSPQVTQQFIDAHRVTRKTDARLKSANNLEPFGRFAEIAARANRLVGRDDGGLTFQGPFSVSAVSPATQPGKRPTLRTSVVAAATILPSDLPQLEATLAGTMFTQWETLTPLASAPESLVVIVGTADITEDEMAEAGRRIVPARDRTQVSLDRAWAWTGGVTYAIQSDDIASLLMSAPVALDEGRVTVRVARDDLGDVQVFASKNESSRIVDDPSPDTMNGVIRLLRPGVRSVRLTLADGRVLTPSVTELPAPYSVSIVYAPELAGDWLEMEPDPSIALSEKRLRYLATSDSPTVPYSASRSSSIAPRNRWRRRRSTSTRIDSIPWFSRVSSTCFNSSTRSSSMATDIVRFASVIPFSVPRNESSLALSAPQGEELLAAMNRALEQSALWRCVARQSSNAGRPICRRSLRTAAVSLWRG